jgi:hypothetical protein
MPKIFRPMATVMAWTFYIVSWIIGLSTATMGIVSGAFYNTTEPTPMIFPVMFLVSLATGLGSIVIMILRKKM